MTKKEITMNEAYEELINRLGQFKHTMETMGMMFEVEINICPIPKMTMLKASKNLAKRIEAAIDEEKKEPSINIDQHFKGLKRDPNKI